MKKIGYILRKFPVLSETFVLNEILAMEALGHEVTIFTLQAPKAGTCQPDLAALKAKVHVLPKKIRFHPSMLKGLWYVLCSRNGQLYSRLLQGGRIAQEAKKLGIDHFHAHFATRSASVAFFASKLSGIPYSFTAHAVDIFKEKVCHKALQAKMNHASFVATVSDYNMKFLSEILPTGSFIKVLNGIDLQKFRPDRCFTFICTARLVEKKGHRYLLEACRILKNRGVAFQCYLIGDGYLKDTLEENIKSFRIENHVFMFGSQSHNTVLSMMRSSDAFVLPCCLAEDGNRDGLPVSLVEALALELPVITTPMTGNTEVVTDQVNGLLVDSTDAEALAEAMERLIIDKALYLKLKENTRSSIAHRFDLKETAKVLSAQINGISV